MIRNVLRSVVAGCVLMVGVAGAQSSMTLDSEARRLGYVVGSDIAESMEDIGPDLDFAAFERGLRHTLEGGEPLLDQAESQQVAQLLMQHIAYRNGQPLPGLPPGMPPPDLDRSKVGLVVGSDAARSLAGAREELDLAAFVAGVRDRIEGHALRIEPTEAEQLRQLLARRMQQRQANQQLLLAQRNRDEGRRFLERNAQADGVRTTASGLQYSVIRQGSGPRPMSNSRVRVHYHGTLLDGTVFDSSIERGQPAEFGLGQVIDGWTEGVALMPVGSKYRFWIPSHLGYGASGSQGGIGPDATLVFDIELLNVL